MLAAAALVLGMGAAHADDSKTLYFYNWTEYVPPGLLEQFTKETGIKVIYSTYESNETMYAKLKTYKDGAYDLVVPSTYFVDKMRKEGMIQKIDKTKLTHFQTSIRRCSTSRLTRITTTPFRISGGNRDWR
jgi:spermidine/putrescine transport system substrate-binding protein